MEGIGVNVGGMAVGVAVGCGVAVGSGIAVWLAVGITVAAAVGDGARVGVGGMAVGVAVEGTVGSWVGTETVSSLDSVAVGTIANVGAGSGMRVLVGVGFGVCAVVHARVTRRRVKPISSRIQALPCGKDVVVTRPHLLRLITTSPVQYRHCTRKATMS